MNYYLSDNYKDYLTDIVLKLSGRLSFEGETNIDHEVSNNLCSIESMLDNIIKILVNNAKSKDRTEYSISRVGKESYSILKEIQSMIEAID